jgi:hypothetical protein
MLLIHLPSAVTNVVGHDAIRFGAYAKAVGVVVVNANDAFFRMCELSESAGDVSRVLWKKKSGVTSC